MQTTMTPEALEADVRRLQLGPDDTIVLTCRSNLSDEVCERIRATMRTALRDPERRVIVLAGGLELSVLDRSEGAPR